MSPSPALHSPNDLLTMVDGKHFELFEGVLREQSFGALGSAITVNVLTLLANFAKPRKLGIVLSSNAGFCCFPEHPRTVIKANGCFFRHDRMTRDRLPEGPSTIPPDLAVFVRSTLEPSNILQMRIAMFLSVGVPIIWDIEPRTQSVSVHHPDGITHVIDVSGSLSGEDVIPGFTCRIADIFE